MNNYKYLDDLITTNKQSVSIAIAPIKVLLGIQNADIQFDSLLTEHLKFAIDKVERYTETYLSRVDILIPFEKWTGDLQLVGGGAMSGLLVKDSELTDVAFTRLSAFKINVDTDKPFTVKYTAGQSEPSEDLKQAVYAIVDIKFNVKEIDEQERKIKFVLKSLFRYVNASRRL